MTHVTDNKSTMISLCMIVKNEEKMLPQCLDSMKDWVDEIIVVDTGSTDRTPSIAESYGARVYHHPWEGDFSKHRNQSISYATGNWIVIMDADETLRSGDGAKLRDAVTGDGVDGVMFTVANTFNNKRSLGLQNQIRLFRRRPDIFYDGIVHNQLVGCTSIRYCPILLYHYGYDLTPDDRQRKFQRTYTLLKRQIKEDPDNYWHRHNLAVCYAVNFMFKDAVQEGRNALRLAEKKNVKKENILWTLYTVAASHMKCENWRMAEETAKRGLTVSNDHLDSHFILVLVYHHEKRWPEMAKHARIYVKLIDRVKASPDHIQTGILHTMNDGWRVWSAMGDSYLENRDMTAAERAFTKAIAETPVPWECYQIIGDCYKHHAVWKESAHYYEKALAHGGDSEDLYLGLALAAKRRGRKNIALLYYEKVLSMKPDSVEALVNLGNLHYENGDEETAQPFYAKALRIEPRLFHVSLRLANISVKKKDIESCVNYCETTLRTLGLPYSHTLDSLSDLADLFVVIGHHFSTTGKEELFMEAMEIAIMLNTGLLSHLEGNKPRPSTRSVPRTEEIS